jgi:four helix bundle protein
MRFGRQQDRPYDIRERAFCFAVQIVKLHQQIETGGSTARLLAHQMLRSGTSVGANIEEADAGHSKQDFIAKCSISLKEARETYFWLRLLHAADIAPAEHLQPLLDEANELIAILTTIIKNARRSTDKS